MVSALNRTTSKRSNESNNRLNSIEKQNSAKSKTGRFLDVDAENNGSGERRFSLRNFFRRPSSLFSAKSSQSNLNKRNSEPENYLLQLLQEKQQQEQQQNLIKSVIEQMGSTGANNNAAPPKIVNSRYSNASNSSSLTSNSANNNAKDKDESVPVAVSSVTGSVLSFHRNKLSDKFPERRRETTCNATGPSSRTLSDTNVNKIRGEQTKSLCLPTDSDPGYRCLLY